MIDYIELLENRKKIAAWWIDGQFQIGGTLSMFLKLPIERIEELYNVKLS